MGIGCVYGYSKYNEVIFEGRKYIVEAPATSGDGYSVEIHVGVDYAITEDLTFSTSLYGNCFVFTIVTPIFGFNGDC